MEKSEAKIQNEIFVWCWNNYCLPKHKPRCMIYHVPNEGKFKLNNVGVYAGAADLEVKRKGRSYSFEVKEPTGGRQSEKQKIFEQHCIDCEVPYFIVRSLEEFQELFFKFVLND